MRKFWKIMFFIFIALNVYSVIPIISFYLGRAPVRVTVNEEVVEKLKENKDPYFSFIVTSDTASGLFLNEASTLKVISGINREDRFKKVPIDFVMNIGDVTFRGRESHYRNYIKMKERIKFPVLDAIGNHDDDLDDGARGEALFSRFCGKAEYAFPDRNSYFIVLDDKNGDFTEKQFIAFKKELQKGKSYEHIFVFMHKPPFNPFCESWYRVETNPWSRRFMELCDKYGVDIVFAGHEEGHRIAKFGSVTYMVTGGGGTLLIQPSSNGGFLNYIVVKVNGNYVDYEVRKVNPPIWEFFAYYMWKELAYFFRGWFN